MLPLYIILGWLVLGTFAWMVFYFRKGSRMTSATTGKVVSAEEKEIPDPNRRLDVTVVTCKFRAMGRDYEVQRTFRGRMAQYFPAGKSVRVRYNPGDPHMSEIAVRE